MLVLRARFRLMDLGVYRKLPRRGLVSRGIGAAYFGCVGIGRSVEWTIVRSSFE